MVVRFFRGRWGLPLEDVFKPRLHAGVELNRMGFTGGGNLPLPFLLRHMGEIRMLRFHRLGGGLCRSRRCPKQRRDRRTLSRIATFSSAWQAGQLILAEASCGFVWTG